MANPSSYKTLAGLVRATTRILQDRKAGATRADGMSMGMWLSNARYAARTTFNNEQAVLDLEQRFAVTRGQDLIGGHSLFGAPLPRRAYRTGDNVPGLGEITDETELQFLIAGSWYHRSIIDTEFRALG